MVSKSGRGKQSFREFTKEANRLKQFIIEAFQSGEIYTEDQLDSYYQDILDDYSNHLETERLDYELWYPRAENKAQDDKEYLRDTYPDNMDYGTGETLESDEFDSQPEDDFEIPDTIFGYPVITSEECLAADGHPRGQILITLEEFEEYILPIPGDAIRGVILQFDENDQIKGFSLCVGDTQ